MVLTSKAMRASKDTTSLRATIPEGIVEFLDLKSGDRIEWNMITNDSGRWVVEVRKAVVSDAA